MVNPSEGKRSAAVINHDRTRSIEPVSVKQSDSLSNDRFGSTLHRFAERFSQHDGNTEIRPHNYNPRPLRPDSNLDPHTLQPQTKTHDARMTIPLPRVTLDRMYQEFESKLQETQKQSEPKPAIMQTKPERREEKGVLEKITDSLPYKFAKSLIKWGLKEVYDVATDGKGDIALAMGAITSLGAAAGTVGLVSLTPASGALAGFGAGYLLYKTGKAISKLLD
jgi:hypothetical protein